MAVLANLSTLADDQSFNDVNGNELLSFQATSSAVNYVEVENAATGDPAIVAARGSDDDTYLQFNVKGNGGPNNTNMACGGR